MRPSDFKAVRELLRLAMLDKYAYDDITDVLDVSIVRDGQILSIANKTPRVMT